MDQNYVEQYHMRRYDQMEPNEIFQKVFKTECRNVGEFSEDLAGNLILTQVQYKVLKNEFSPDSETKMKMVNFDLKIASEGTPNYSEDFNEKRFENFLKWIAGNSPVFSKLASLNTERSGVTFVTKSEVISKILFMPYVTEDSCSFYATYIRGAVYMMNFRKDLSVKTQNNYIDWFHKFEQYMCGEDTNQGIAPNDQHRIVLTCKLGPYDVIYHKAKNYVRSETRGGQKNFSNFVNLKLTTWPNTPSAAKYFNRKIAFNWVVPMVIGGVDETIAGFAKRNGRVKEVRLYTEEDLKEAGKDYWNLNKNFTFAVDFLHIVKEKTKSNPGDVFLFQNEKNQNFVTCEKEGKKFVPDWFVEKLKTLERLSENGHPGSFKSEDSLNSCLVL